MKKADKMLFSGALGVSALLLFLYSILFLQQNIIFMVLGIVISVLMFYCSKLLQE